MASNKKSLAVIALSVSQLLAQLATQLIIIRSIGVNDQSDLYFLSQTIPTFFSAIILCAIISTWAERISRETGDFNQRIAVSQAQLLSIILGISTGIIYLPLTPWWFSSIFSIDFSNSTSTIIILTITFTMSGILNNLIAILGIYTKNHSSINVEIINLSTYLVAIPAVYIFVPKYGIAAAVLVQLARLLFTTYSLSLVYKIPYSSISKESYKQLFRKKFIFDILSPSIYKLMPIIDRSLISNSPAGVVTIFTLSQTIISSFSFVVEKYLSHEFSRKLIQTKGRENRNHTLEIIKISAITSITFAAFLFLISNDLNHLFATHFNYNEANNTSITWVLILLSGQLFAALSGPLLVFNLNINSKNVIATSISLTGFFIGILFKLILFPKFGIFGVCIATSIYMVINVFSFKVAAQYKV